MKYKTGVKDFIWFFIIAAVILIFSSIPYWNAQFAETSDLRFRCIYYDKADYAVHVSMMQAGRMGDWAYSMFSNTRHHPGIPEAGKSSRKLLILQRKVES